MAFEHLNRKQRRAMMAYAIDEASRRPTTMTEIPIERWPADYRNSNDTLMAAYESCEFLAQLYLDGSTLRMSVCRATLQPDGRWEANLSWDELMRVKRECGFGDIYAVEVYPRDSDIVNVANMRHLWLQPKPLPIGWFAAPKSALAEVVA